MLIAHAIVSLFQLIPVPKMVGGRGRARSGSVTLSLAGSTSGMGAYFRRQLLVDSKFLLGSPLLSTSPNEVLNWFENFAGLWGIIIVLLSVSTSVALCSAFGIKVTLIIAEVIPFLVLAIGVDNVFILSHELDQQNSRAYAAASRHGPLFVTYDDQDDEDGDGLPLAEERVARALGRMGPSILLSASCETVAFGLGAMVGMVRYSLQTLGNQTLILTLGTSLPFATLRFTQPSRSSSTRSFRSRSSSARWRST